VVDRPEPSDSADADADESLAEAFWSLTRSLRQAAQESMAQWDITPSQARALRVLERHGVMRPSELSDHLRIAARSATEVIDDLEAKDLVRRGPDPNDRRATLIELTDRGHELGQQIRAARGAQAERLFDELSPTDRADLIRILRQLRPS
jgi:DNA-binding MarR family transcriptional regulator